jgi:hypothetical protein
LERPSVVIIEVEDFIKRFTNGELVLSPEAKNMTWTAPIGKNFLGRPKNVTKRLPDIIGWAVATYQLNKDAIPRSRLESAYELLDLRQRARAFGLIKNPQQQTRDYEQEIKQLKEQIASLRALNDKLTKENKRLHNLLPIGNDRDVGDVEAP